MYQLEAKGSTTLVPKKSTNQTLLPFYACIIFTISSECHMAIIQGAMSAK